MRSVIDQTSDLNLQQLHRYNKLYNLPDFVKKADFQRDVCQPENPSPRVYADVRAPYQFPIHTKAAAFVSYLYFLEKEAEINPKVRDIIRERLNRAADFFKISNTVKALQEKHASLHKDSYPDSTYAIVWAADGHKERRYPMRNALEVKAAASWFKDNLSAIRNEFSFSDRRVIAEKILEKAAHFGAAIGEEYTELLEQQAGRGMCSPTETAKLIRDRVKAGHRVTPAIAERMEKLAHLVENRPSAFLDPATMGDLATTIDQFDRNHALLNKYSALIPAPESVLFKATYTKTAALRDNACKLITGNIYDIGQFEKISLSDLGNLFGDELATEVANGLHVDPVKLAEIAATLPREGAVMFDDLMANHGLAPFAKEASHATGFSFAELKKMSV